MQHLYKSIMNLIILIFFYRIILVFGFNLITHIFLGLLGEPWSKKCTFNCSLALTAKIYLPIS